MVFKSKFYGFWKLEIKTENANIQTESEKALKCQVYKHSSEIKKIVIRERDGRVWGMALWGCARGKKKNKVESRAECQRA